MASDRPPGGKPQEPGTRSDDPLAVLQHRLGVSGLSGRRLLAAVTHRTFRMEHPELAGEDYERLEFLGDAVIELAACHLLWDRLPEADEGRLTQLRNALVRKESLARCGARIELDRVLRLGEAIRESSNFRRSRETLLAQSLEALVGAIYLELGWPAAKQVCDQLLLPELERALEQGAGPSPKQALQELVARAGWRQGPEYELVGSSGPPHAPRFRCQVRVAGEVLGVGEGRSKKQAEEAAAREALSRWPQRSTPPIAAR